MEDTTQKTQEQENQENIEEMIRNAEKGEQPSETVAGTVVSKGDDTEAPAPMVVSSISGGGRVKVYDTITGDESWVLYNKDTGGMLRQVLTWKRSDGSLIYSTKPPRDKEGNIIRPARGTIKCLLHPSGPNRPHYNEMGLPVCRKSNFTSRYMVERHMKNRHPSAWAIIEKERTDAEKLEDRELQKALVKGVQTSIKKSKK